MSEGGREGVVPRIFIKVREGVLHGFPGYSSRCFKVM